jgi:hypothetical protein
MDKINRMAENYGIDEVMWAAAHEHLKKLGVVQDEPGEAAAAEAPAGPGETDAVEGPAGPIEERPEGQSEAANWMSV